jgi:putative CRISPR-associated protein (TIGR02619 family)
MLQKMGELRTLPVDLAAARLRALFNPADGGAENETLYHHCRPDALIDRRRLLLFCSDTDEGEAVARILERRFHDSFQRIEVIRCKDLRDDDPRRFAGRGLRSLVNNLVNAINQLRKLGHEPAIDATGGYKPQIAYAALVGQVMQVPVYYRYMAFPDVITLQPLPVSVDPQVWFDHLWFFERLREELLPDREIPRYDERIAPLLEREDRLVTLSPLGELMAGVVEQLLQARAANLVPPPCDMPPDEKGICIQPY